MAPESLDGGDFDAKTDQYSFCSAMRAVILGEPHAADTLDQTERAGYQPDHVEHVGEYLHVDYCSGRGTPQWYAKVILL